MPVMYILLRPKRSDKCPASGVVTADSAVAHITAASSRLRELCNTPLPHGSQKRAWVLTPPPPHAEKGPPTPPTADAYALNEAHDREGHRAPDADRGVTRDEADREGRQAGQEQSRDQGHLAPDAVA